MSRRVVGTLLEPGGDPMTGILRIVARDDFIPGVVEGSLIDLTATSGAYDVTLINGVYRVDLNTAGRFIPVGEMTIEDGADATLPELLGN